jgi:hypothetical protein
MLISTIISIIPTVKILLALIKGCLKAKEEKESRGGKPDESFVCFFI